VVGAFSVHGIDEQLFGVNEQISVQGQSEQEAEKTYRQRGAISWPPSKK